MSQQRRIGDAPVAQRIGNYIWRRPKQPRYSRVSQVRARTIGQVMRDTRGNKSQAAKRLGITRTQLYGRLHKYGLDSPAHS